MADNDYDIYVSYAPEDMDRVRKIVEELEWAGLKVWFRNQPASSKESIDLLQQQMDASRVHLVIWSHNSAASGRVQAEARVGSLKGRLIAARLDVVIPPRGTEAVAYSDLSTWQGGQEHRQMKKLLHGIHRLIGKGVAPEAMAQESFSDVQGSELDMLSAAEKDERAWEIASSYNNKTYFQHYLDYFPNGKYTEQAKESLAKKKRNGRIVLTCAIIWVVAQTIFALVVNLATL
ncbi:MAG TPA: toll/interleukin-1 receptor domain-containing protein [Bacteroidetes bacterium]|nr:toll/interleukin-1 receptor domain-containing protein [Bacteroidota bacterium]